MEDTLSFEESFNRAMKTYRQSFDGEMTVVHTFIGEHHGLAIAVTHCTSISTVTTAARRICCRNNCEQLRGKTGRKIIRKTFRAVCS